MNKAIKEIVLDIDGTEIKLTPEQARKLQGALNELLAAPQKADDVLDKFRKLADGMKKPEREYVPVPYPVPQPIYPRPWRQPYWYYDTYTVTCDSVPMLYKSGTVTMSLGSGT